MALEATGAAGHPEEWPENLLSGSRIDSATIRRDLWSRQSTPNGLLGVKFSYYEPTIQSFLQTFGPDAGSRGSAWRTAWGSVFPNCRHLVMMRRDKLRLAVSWWKAINGGPGHVSHDGSLLPWQDSVPATPEDLPGVYDFAAIKALVLESVQREAGIQALLTTLGVVPLTVVYEDFVADYERTVQNVLAYLHLDAAASEIPPPALARTSDGVNEAWRQRFLADLANERG